MAAMDFCFGPCMATETPFIARACLDCSRWWWKVTRIALCPLVLFLWSFGRCARARMRSRTAVPGKPKHSLRLHLRSRGPAWLLHHLCAWLCSQNRLTWTRVSNQCRPLPEQFATSFSGISGIVIVRKSAVCILSTTRYMSLSLSLSLCRGHVPSNPMAGLCPVKPHPLADPERGQHWHCPD